MMTSSFNHMEQSVEQWCDSLLSVKMLEHQPFFFSDNLFYHPEISIKNCGMYGEQVPRLFRIDDGLLLGLLLILFFMFVGLAGSKHLMAHLVKRFFAPLREQANLFDGDTKVERRHMRFLTALNVFLPASLLCDYILRQDWHFQSERYPYLCLSLSILFFGVYYCFKYLLTTAVDWTFFDKIKCSLCSESRNFLYAVQGLLFSPLLFYSVFFELSLQKLLLCALVLVVFVKILLLYKYWTIFFSKTYGILHFIVYFCALEIIPVLVLWRILAFVSNSFI